MLQLRSLVGALCVGVFCVLSGVHGCFFVSTCCINNGGCGCNAGCRMCTLWTRSCYCLPGYVGNPPWTPCRPCLPPPCSCSVCPCPLPPPPPPCGCGVCPCPLPPPCGCSVCPCPAPPPTCGCGVCPCPLPPPCGCSVCPCPAPPPCACGVCPCPAPTCACSVCPCVAARCSSTASCSGTGAVCRSAPRACPGGMCAGEPTCGCDDGFEGECDGAKCMCVAMGAPGPLPSFSTAPSSTAEITVTCSEAAPCKGVGAMCSGGTCKCGSGFAGKCEGLACTCSATTNPFSSTAGGHPQPQPSSTAGGHPQPQPSANLCATANGGCGDPSIALCVPPNSATGSAMCVCSSGYSGRPCMPIGAGNMTDGPAKAPASTANAKFLGVFDLSTHSGVMTAVCVLVGVFIFLVVCCAGCMKGYDQKRKSTTLNTTTSAPQGEPEPVAPVVVAAPQNTPMELVPPRQTGGIEGGRRSPSIGGRRSPGLGGRSPNFGNRSPAINGRSPGGMRPGAGARCAPPSPFPLDLKGDTATNAGDLEAPVETVPE